MKGKSISINGEPVNGIAAPPEPGNDPKVSLDDVGNGARFAERYNGIILFDHSREQWMIYDGTRYAVDATKHVWERAESLTWEMTLYAAEMADEALEKWATKSRSRDRVSAMLSGAMSKPNVAVTVDELDKSPYLLNVKNGTLDLGDGVEFHSHDPVNRLTKVCPMDHIPDATAPLFLEILHKVIPDEPTRVWLQTRIGYSLTGLKDIHEVYICHGLGSNGKSTLLEHCFLPLMGDYGCTVNASTFQRKTEDHGPRADLVKLIGKRFVLAGEANERRALDEALIKQVTGEDMLSARGQYMRKEVDFFPIFKPWMMENHRPDVDGGDWGIWRRLKMILFGVTISDAEAEAFKRIHGNVTDRLHDELSGILNWALQGLLLLRSGTVPEPQAVTLATAKYREDSDAIGRFLEDCCVVDADGKTTVQRCSDVYGKWCKDRREDPLSSQRLNKKLEDKGFTRSRSQDVRFWKGFSIKGEQGKEGITEEFGF